jgi:hypothetical protein
MKKDKNCLECGAPLDKKINRSIGEFAMIVDKEDMWFLLQKIKSLELSEREKEGLEKIKKRYVAKIKKYLKKVEQEHQLLQDKPPFKQNKDSKKGSDLMDKFLKGQKKKRNSREV